MSFYRRTNHCTAGGIICRYEQQRRPLYGEQIRVENILCIYKM
jgi:hypothetical protein